MASEPLSPPVSQNPPSPLVTRIARVATAVTNTIRVPHDRFVDRQSQWYSTDGMPPVIAGNQVKFYVDAIQAFPEMVAAIRTTNSANHFIYMVNWFCDINFHLAASGKSNDLEAETNLKGLLTDASKKGVMIRAMFWKMPAGLAQNREAILFLNGLKEIRTSAGPQIVPEDNDKILKTAAAIHDQRGDHSALPIPILSIFPRAIGAQHQKFLCVSGDQGLVCFCGGIDFNPDRISNLGQPFPTGPLPPSFGPLRTFIGKIKRSHGRFILKDTADGFGSSKEFGIDDQEAAEQFLDQEVTLRGRLDEVTNIIQLDTLQGGQTSSGNPLHDVHCRIIGPAAPEFVKLFTKKWIDHPSSASIDKKRAPLLPSPPAPASGEHFVQVGTTFGRTGYTSIKPDQTAAAMIAHAIRNAKRFIYTECQYFTGTPELEAALKAALPNIEHLTVLVTHWEVSDLPTVNFHRREFFNKLKAAGGDKVRFFSLQPDGNTSEFQAGKVPHTYVHAKIWVVDDEFAVIGSVNSNRRSWSHDAEVAAGIYETSTDSVLRHRFAHLMRIAIWQEHLNMQSAEGAAELTDGVASAVHWIDPPSGARVRPYNLDEKNNSGANDQHIPVPILAPLLEALTWDGVFDPP